LDAAGYPFEAQNKATRIENSGKRPSSVVFLAR
jgi:hypothetical protein